MSQITDKARLEAERAEAENPDEEPAEPTPAEPGEDEAAEAEEQPAEPEAKKRRQPSPQEQFDKVFQSFRSRLATLFEVPVSEVVPAPHPGVAGVMLPGFAEPKTHENYTRCSTCNGRGFVLTQAVTGKLENDQHVCPDTRCKGRGYWEKAQAVAEAPTTGPLAVTQPPQGNGEYADAPAWMGDPNLSPGA